VTFQKNPATLVNVFERLTPEACYWAGVLATDGCMSNSMGKKTVAFSCCDLDLTTGFAHFIGGTVTKKTAENGVGRDQWRTRVVRPNAFDFLVALGITERKSLTLAVSPILAASRDFWRGAVDGDGSVVCRDGKYFAMNLASSSSVFINQFLLYLRTLGLIYERQVKPQRSGNDHYVVTLAGISCLQLLKELYTDPCFALSRKKILADACIALEPFYVRGRLRLRAVSA